MPGDTKIKNTPQGWIDVDNPTVFHSARRFARAARRNGGSLPTRVTSSPHTVTASGTAPTNVTINNVTINNDPGLTSLQQRLYDRLTQTQGVTAADAFDVITNNGYNKAASYGHMREAGATHAEALAIINLDVPDVSLAYGLARADGFDHTDALKDALAPWTTHQWPLGSTSDGDD